MSTLILAFAASVAAAPPPPKPRVAFRYDIVLKVADRDAAADGVTALAEKRDGYFLERTDDMVRLRVPTASVKELLAAIEPLGTVVDRKSQAQDLGDALDQQRTLLGSRTQMLGRYFSVLADAGPDEVVAVERQMTELVEAIESIKGSLKLWEHQLQYAEVVVNFRFRDRRAPVNDGRSSFAWLNTVNLSDLLAEFAGD